MKLPNPNTKTRRVLDALLAGGSFNFIEAQQSLHDRSLHSTISSLQNEYGIKISRKNEVINGYKGNPTHCVRYWICWEERNRIALNGAIKVLV